jgi:N-acetylglucosaminyl-diphospho-decaprenol L-rhamnosyltransferase
LAEGRYFCVLNPDIELPKNPFPILLSEMSDRHIGLVAPRVIGPDGNLEDTMRSFLTPWSMLKRLTRYDSGAYFIKPGQTTFNPDWVAGMFMLFRNDAFAQVHGFDQHYFMYCEDTDICTRLWKSGFEIVGCPRATVIHNAQRASHKALRHLSWHLRSMFRYFLMHSFSLPNKNEAARSISSKDPRKQ